MESNDSMQRMADTWNDHADHKHPKVQKHIKKAEAAYNNQDHEGFYHHTQRAADHAYELRKQKKESVEVNELKTSTIASYQRKAGKEYSKYKKSDRMDYDKAQGLADAGKTTQKHADSMSKNQDKYKKRGEGLARSKKVLAKRYSDKEVRMGKGVAFDKRYKGGNMTGAAKAINKIKKGLADHPKVSNALRQANEQLNQEGE